MAEKSSVFDMIGPVMIGPSSSHTAGVVRIGKVAMSVLGDIPEEAGITFYNSFARTYEGHGSDRAILAGLLGYETDDIRIKNSFQHAEKTGLIYKFKSIGNASTFHPNSIRLDLKKGDKKIEVIGESRGGGVIRIVEINGFTANFTASLHTLIITTDDTKGNIAFISNILANDKCNVATMSVSRKGKRHLACQAIEMDSGLRDISLQYIHSLDWVHDVIYIPVINN